MNNNVFLMLLVCLMGTASAATSPGIKVCSEYWGAAEMVENCVKDFVDMHRGHSDAELRKWFDAACSSRDDILQCVETRTEQCGNKAVIRNEARSLLQFCDANGWYMKYKNVASGSVSKDCIRMMRRLCHSPSPSTEFSLSASVEEGVAVWQRKVVSLFNCQRHGAQWEAPTYSECVASPKDIMFALLMNVFVGQVLGISLRPEQVAQLETLFGN